MNILPKKRWHVRNKDNKARVQKDEALAAEREKESLRKAAFAEQEAKLDVLRSSSGPSDHPSSQLPCSAHINLFEAISTKDGSSTTNVEHEKEKKAEQEAREKRIGILTYLGQSQLDSKGPRVWEARVESADDTKSSRSDRDRKRKLDPLTTMEKYTRKSSKSKHHSKDKDKAEKTSSSSRSIEALRAERLERERRERQRVRELFSGAPPESSKTDESDSTRYSSQYNPHLAKRRK